MSDLFTIVAAAGRGSRLGAQMNKAFVEVAGLPLLVHTLVALAKTAVCKKVAVVVAPGEIEYASGLLARNAALFGCLECSLLSGGQERQHSIANALKVLPPECAFVAVHDGARPFVSPAVFTSVLSAARAGGAAIAAVPVKDTVKLAEHGFVQDTPARDRLFLVQTPQIFAREVLLAAYDKAFVDGFLGTDDASLVERLGQRVAIVAGDYDNIKITTPDDLFLAGCRLEDRVMRFSVGMGYDVHQLVRDRALVVGGVRIPHELGLLGHSDADVLLHAISDALLGAAGLGDIGKHFPDTDERYAGADSMVLLQEVMAMLAAARWRVNNIDAVIMAQQPKMAPYRGQMCENIARVCLVDPAAVNVKATTTEKLGFVGRSEGIAAQAVVSLAGI